MGATKVQCIVIKLVYLVLFITEVYSKPDPTAETGCEIQRRCVPNGPEKHDCFWDPDARECLNISTSKAEPGCKMQQRCVSKEPENHDCGWYSNVLGDTCFRGKNKSEIYRFIDYHCHRRTAIDSASKAKANHASILEQLGLECVGHQVPERFGTAGRPVDSVWKIRLSLSLADVEQKKQRGLCMKIHELLNEYDSD